MSDAYYFEAAERFHAANAPEAAGRSRKDRPGAAEDEPSKAEAERDEAGE